MNEYQKLDEDILALTGHREWKESFMTLLEAEASAALQNQINAEDWDDVMYQRGYRAALAFVANIREATKILIAHADANGDV